MRKLNLVGSNHGRSAFEEGYIKIRLFPSLVISGLFTFMIIFQGVIAHENERTNLRPSAFSRSSFVHTNKEGRADITWQIDDYVTHLMGIRPAASAEELNQNQKLMWYFQTLDVKGGFASVAGAIEGWMEFVLFRKSDGTDFIGKMSVGCGPACDYSFTFYTGKNERITRVEFPTVFPMERMEKERLSHWDAVQLKYPVEYAEDYQYRFVFPQKGTDINVDLVLGADEIQIPFAVLSWNRMTFAIKGFSEDFSN